MIPEKVQRVLAAHGLKAIEFEEGMTPTAGAAAAAIGVAVGQIAKSLLFKDRTGKYHMVVCAGDARVSSGKLKRLVGAPLSMASSDETFAQTGFRPGGVCPFGVDGLPIWVDRGLSRHATIYPAAGTDASGVPMSYAQLLQSCGGTECEVCSDEVPH